MAEGLDRKHSLALQIVGLDLPRLLEQIHPRPQAADYVHRLGSLARMALSAGCQKRNFLRGHGERRPELTAGFRLERARLLVVARGAVSASRALLDSGSVPEEKVLELARQMRQRLEHVLREDGEACLMNAIVDDWPDSAPTRSNHDPRAEQASITTHIEDRLQTASALHAPGLGDTATLILDEDEPLTPPALAQLLRQAWQRTDLIRLRFARRTIQATRPLFS